MDTTDDDRRFRGDGATIVLTRAVHRAPFERAEFVLRVHDRPETPSFVLMLSRDERSTPK